MSMSVVEVFVTEEHKSFLKGTHKVKSTVT